MPRITAAPDWLDRYLRESERGNHTSVEVAAPPSAVWAALHAVTLKDCRASMVLLAARSLPGRITGRGTYASASGVASTTEPLLPSMSPGRFVTLEEAPGEEVVLGVIGQFWKVGGGADLSFEDAAEFVAFEHPGYVKVALNFRVQPSSSGTTLTTETRCHTTDPGTARRFALYWALIGWGSKLIRWEMLTVVRRRAEANHGG